MKKTIQMIFFTSIIYSPQILLAQNEQQVQQESLEQTQAVISQPEKRIEVIKTNPNAQKIDDQVKQLMGQNSENMYKTASDFLPYILQMGQGDPVKMTEFLTKAARDPASFANQLPPELKQKIIDLSDQVKPVPEKLKP